MAYKPRAQQERELVDIVLSVGLKGHAESDEGNKTYYEFRLADGTLRYCTNMSKENLRRLGL